MLDCWQKELAVTQTGHLPLQQDLLLLKKKGSPQNQVNIHWQQLEQLATSLPMMNILAQDNGYSQMAPLPEYSQTAPDCLKGSRI